jgi:hypothetical protein
MFNGLTLLIFCVTFLILNFIKFIIQYYIRQYHLGIEVYNLS